MSSCAKANAITPSSPPWAEPTRPAPRSLCGCAWPVLLLLLLTAGTATASTVVHRGTVRQISGPADLDLEGEIVYAINFSTDDPVRVLRGVPFLPDHDPIPGATLVGPQQVTPWQNRPEFGDSPDDEVLEDLCHDIRWANAGGGERLRATLAVQVGEEYQLQILISANTSEDRRWDIRVDGNPAVDEITSLGASPGQSYAPDRATLYTCRVLASTGRLEIEMGNLFGNNDGGDRNPIWQALTLERLFIPPTPQEIRLAPTTFFATQATPIGRFAVVDGKTGATHRLALVPGEGDADNAKFVILDQDLHLGAFDFAHTAVGTEFHLRVAATDSADAQRTLERTFTVRLEAPHAPTGLTLDAGSISTRATAGALVARLRAEDADAFESHTFVLSTGDGDRDNGGFRVEGDALWLEQSPAANARDAQIRLRATDSTGLTFERAVVLPFRAPQVRLNEILASESAGVVDEAGEPQEWMELRNTLDQYVDLAGWQLTDDPRSTSTWTFPSQRLAPGGFVVVLADGRGTPPAGSTLLHASFSLNAAGETLALFAPGEGTAQDRWEFPLQFPRVAYGRDATGTLGYLRAPTPGAANAERVEAGQNEVRLSHPRGFYDAGFNLTLEATLTNSEIRYTLDGTLPSASAGTVYTGPVPILPNTSATTRGTRIVRAVALHPQAAFAPVATHTYLFIDGVTGPTVDAVRAQSRLVTPITRHAVYGPLLPAAFRALPAVSVVLPSGPTSAERAASVELFDPEHQEPGFQIDCGVAATGTSSLGSPKLSMAARFRQKYGAARLRYPVFAHGSMFPERAAEEFKELRLRSHSHDTFYWLATRENPPTPYGSPAVTRGGDAQLMRNLWMDEMQLEMGQLGKHGRQVHLYLNGSYHGIYHIHEHADEDYLASYLPGSSADYHYTGAALGGSDHGAGDTWSKTWSQVKASLGNYAEARRWIDVTNLCDYMLLSFYGGNDWDWSAQHNWSAAGPRLPDRGGWKFFQQDSDISLQDVAADCTDQDVPDGLFGALMRHADFRALFRDRVVRHCYGNGPLTPTRAQALYDARMEEIRLAIVAETARWQPSSSVATLPWDRDQEWTIEWNYFRQTFFPQRTDRLIQQLRRHSGWWPADPPTTDTPAGTVPPGTVVHFNGAGRAVYFTTDGSDPRLPGGGINPTARSSAGGTTLEATLVPTGATWHFLDAGQVPGPDWITGAFDEGSWKSGPAEIGYGDGDEATVCAFVDADPATAGVQKNLTTYFRRTFDVTNPALRTPLSLRLRLLCDDGAAVYLNGQEIARVNLPAGPLDATTRASAGVGGTDETVFQELTLPAPSAALRATGNVLAVEVHQQSPDSSDISFNLEFAVSGRSDGGTTGVVVDQPVVVRARTYTGTDWSGLTEYYFVPANLPPATGTGLAISEIHYHPSDDAETEFLEFHNYSAQAFDLSDCTITGAVDFRFPAGTVLGADERLVVARNPTAFDARYLAPESAYHLPGVRRLGPWVGSLSNAGESLGIRSAQGESLLVFAYGTAAPWPTRADGFGSSLELLDNPPLAAREPERSAWFGEARHWQASPRIHGSPGSPAERPPFAVVLNELIAAPAAGETDALELLNRGTEPVDLSGWLLSDSPATLAKYRFPTGTRLEPGQRRVLTEADFGTAANPNALVPFGLSSTGDEVLLIRTASGGQPLRFEDHVRFAALPVGVSLGRVPDGVGAWQWLATASLGAINTAPRRGYAAWAATRFPPETSEADRAPDRDPDGNGLANFSEYAFVLGGNIEPVAPLEGRWKPGVNGGFELTVRMRPDATDITYRLESSTDLRTWVDTQPFLQTTGETATSDGALRRTWRLTDAGAASPFTEAGAVFLRARAEPR